jgi:hypothetical protein
MIILSQSIATLDWATGPPLIQIKERSCRITSESLVHVLAAFVLALPVGWNRTRAEQGAGIHIFPLVAVANCGFVQTGISVLGAGVVNQANPGQGVITAGFVGAARSSRKALQPPATLRRQASGPSGL